VKTRVVSRILVLAFALTSIPSGYAVAAAGVRPLGALSCEANFSASLRAERVVPVAAPDEVNARFPNPPGSANTHHFSAVTFKKLWREMTARFSGRSDVSLSKWSDQTPLDAKILKIKITSRENSSTPPLRVLITGGVHGNEPLGLLTALDLVDVFASGFEGRPVELTILPALNVDGLASNRRRLSDGQDLNRLLDDEEPSAKVTRIKEAIGTQPFDLSLDLHGSHERKQFFVIKQGDDRGLAERAIRVLPNSLRLKADNGDDTGPVGVSGLRGYEPGRYQLEAPGISTSVNKGTLKSYMSGLGTRYAYTLEYPGQISFEKARRENLKLALAMIREALRLQP